jgi:hypothetical protein
MSKVILEDIYAEDLFRWFLDHVIFSGGDGAAAIVCANYEDAARYFIDWYHTEFDKPFWHVGDAYEHTINFHDENENFIFTNNSNIILHRGDYIFIVQQDCRFAKEPKGSTKTVKAIK